MPYPCSHFYFDIKFGYRLYSKEKRRACRQIWYQSKSDYMDRALGLGNLCENLFPLWHTLEESSSGSESSGFIRRPFRNLLRSRLQPTTTSSTTEKPTIVYELRCFSKLFFILHRYFLKFEISKKSRLLVFFNFQERIKKSKEMSWWP